MHNSHYILFCIFSLSSVFNISPGSEDCACTFYVFDIKYSILLFCSINKNYGIFVLHIAIYQFHSSFCFFSPRDIFHFGKNSYVIQPKLVAVNRCFSFQFQLGK